MFPPWDAFFRMATRSDRSNFVSKADQRLTFAVRGHMVEVVTDDDEEE